MSLRKIFACGLLAGGLGLLAAQGLYLSAQRGGGEDDGVGTRGSPGTRPFVDELPIIPVAQPVKALDPPVDTARFQRYDEFPAKVLYEIRQQEAYHTFHKDLPPTLIWGYDGIYPGPTFHARYGQPVIVRFHNDLPADHVGFGIPSTVIHLHNGHTASESDGFPGDFFEPGTYRDNHYANFPAGGDMREALGTLWYHDHRLDFTAANAYRGLTGFYLLFDELDSGDENDPNPKALRLPSGPYDVPLVIQDKRFDADGQLVFNQFNLDGILGNKEVVNGKIQPYFRVARRKYRFRLLNAGPSRFYEFFLGNGQRFTQISSDGNLLPQPLVRQSIRLGVAERADVIIDFSNAQIGDQIVLQNRLEQINGRGPSGRILNPGTPLLRFEVDRDEEDNSQVPATLRELPPVDLAEVVRTRTFTFNRNNGAWAVNGRFFNVNRVDATVQQGTAEIWVFQNPANNWSHPIHGHFEEFQILSRNGQPPPPDEVSRKDMARLAPGQNTRVFVRFRDFLGKYLVHCHNMVHEDHAMMIRFDIVP